MASTFVLKNQRNAFEEPFKDQGMCIFADTEFKVYKKVTFTWDSLFQAFQDKEFQMLMQNDVSTELIKEVYTNIINYGLHKAVVKTLVLPCSDMIEWITRKIDHEN